MTEFENNDQDSLLQYHWVLEAYSACQKYGLEEEAKTLKTKYIDHYTGGSHFRCKQPGDKVAFMQLLAKIQNKHPEFMFGPTGKRSVSPRSLVPPGDRSVIISGPPGGDGMGNQQSNFKAGEFMEAAVTSEVEGEMADLQQYYSWLESEWSEGEYHVGFEEFMEITRRTREKMREEEEEASKAKANPSK